MRTLFSDSVSSPIVSAIRAVAAATDSGRLTPELAF
jgi:hypothetical protein